MTLNFIELTSQSLLKWSLSQMPLAGKRWLWTVLLVSLCAFLQLSVLKKQLFLIETPQHFLLWAGHIQRYLRAKRAKGTSRVVASLSSFSWNAWLAPRFSEVKWHHGEWKEHWSLCRVSDPSLRFTSRRKLSPQTESWIGVLWKYVCASVYLESISICKFKHLVLKRTAEHHSAPGPQINATLGWEIPCLGKRWVLQ